MPIVHDNFAELVDLDPVLNEIWWQHYNAVSDPLAQLFNIQSTSKAKETDLRVGSFSDPVELEEGVRYDTALPDYTVTYTPVEYARGFQVTRFMLDTMQYGGIFDSASNMGTAFARFRAKQRASVFNNFNSASYLGYDSKALCANDHPRSEADSTAVDNLLALGLTAANLDTAMQTLEGLVDDKGEEAGAMPNLLITGGSLRKTARELVGSELDPESGENAINVFAEDLQYMYVPRITSTKWFVVDAGMARKYLKWFDLTMPEFGAEDDFDTLNRKFRGYMAFSYGWSDFRWVVGSTP